MAAQTKIQNYLESPRPGSRLSISYEELHLSPERYIFTGLNIHSGVLMHKNPANDCVFPEEITICSLPQSIIKSKSIEAAI